MASMAGMTEISPDIRLLEGMFTACFPGIIRKADTVRSILSDPSNRILAYAEDDTILGAVVWNRNTVIMLCVLPVFRSRGIGSVLLCEAEKRIAAEGYDEIRFCDGFGYLTPGIPCEPSFPEYRGNRAFFEKRGYIHSWGECECVDMAIMDMTRYKSGGLCIGDTVNGITYRYAEADDMQRVIDCTDDGWSDFTRYYESARLYEPSSSERVLIAEKDGIIVGVLMVCFETECRGVGSVGCTVTRPSFREMGIATTLVRLGTGEFAARGIPRAFLGYTYTDIIPMYARCGYEVSMHYFMGVKKLSGR